MTESTDVRTAPRQRRRRRLRNVLLVLLGVVVLVVVLAPTIAGPVAAPIVERAVNDRIKGHAEVGTLRLGWFGPQRAALTLDDPEGGRVADVSVRVEKSLFGFLTAPMRVGIVRVEGEASVVRGADGRTNLERAVEPRFPAPPEPEPDTGGPVTLPGGLSASLVLDGVRVTLTDAAIAEATGGQIGTVRAGDLRGSLDFAVGRTTTLTIKSPILTGADATRLAESGSLDVEVTIDDLTDASGLLTVVALRARARLALSAPALDASFAGEFAGGVLSRTGESRVVLDAQELSKLVPAVSSALVGQPGVEVAGLPRVTVSIDELRFPVGADLRAAAATVRVETSETHGRVALRPGEPPAPFRIEPLRLTLAAPSLAESVTLSGGTSASIAGESAGELAVDLRAAGLLDEAGALRAGVPGSVAGGVRVRGFATAIVQPYLAAVNTMLPGGARVELPRDFGPTVSASLEAKTVEGAADAYDIDVALEAERASLSGAVAVRGQRVASREGGVRARVDSLAPVLDNLLASRGVRIDRGVGVALEASDFAVDLSRLGGASGLDLRGTRAVASLTVEGTAGAVQLEGHDRPFAFAVERIALGVATDDVAGEVRVTADSSVAVDGGQLAQMRADFTLADLLDGAGGPRTASLPTFRGEARVDGLRHGTLDDLLAPMLAPTGLTLARELGPRGDLLLVGASDPDAGPNATRLDLTYRSGNLDLTAPLALTPDRVRTREPVTLVARAAGETLSRLVAGPSPARVAPSGVFRLSLADLDVPIVEGFVPPPNTVRAALSVTLSDFAADVDLAPADAPGRLGPQRVSLGRLTLALSASPGAAPTVSADALMEHDGSAFTASLRSTLDGLFLSAPADPADPMSVVSVAGLRPQARLRLVDAPISLARLVPPIVIDGTPLDTALIARDGIGRTITVDLATEPVERMETGTRLTLDVRGQAFAVQSRGRVAAGEFRVFGLEGRAGASPRLVRHLTDVFAKDAPVAPGLSALARADYRLLEEFAVPLDAAYRPQLAGAAGSIRTSVVISAPLASITLPASEGAQPLTVPPVVVKDLTVESAVPLALLGGGDGAASVSYRGQLLKEDESLLAALTGSLNATIKGGKLEGDAPAKLAVTRFDAAWADALLAKPALVAGAVGDRINLTLDADVRRLLYRLGPEPSVMLAVDAPRFKTGKPIGLVLNKTALFAPGGFDLTWTIGPAWGNHYLLGRTPDGPASALTLTEPTAVTVAVTRMAFAVAEGSGPFKPGTFIVNATVALPDASAQMSDGSALRARDVSFRVGRGPTPEQIGFTLSVPSLQIAGGQEVKPRNSRIDGTISSFADAEGNLTAERATLDVDGGIAPIPTAVVDALARQNGLIVDAAGATADLTLNAKGLSTSGGTLHATLTTPLLRAEARGAVRDGLLVLEKGVLAEVFQVTPALTKRFQKAIPTIASLEKTRDDKPAQIILTSPIALPIDGNLDRLNGSLTIDIGTARFGTQDLFQRVLSVAHQKTAGEVGRRLPPLKVTMADGLVSYDPYPLPFGEFTLETQGFINLGSKPRTIRTGGGAQLGAGRLEVLTFIPAGAFVSEAMPVAVPPGIARVPIRTQGPIAAPSNNVAVDLMGRETVNNLIDSGKIREEAEGLLKRLIDRK